MKFTNIVLLLILSVLVCFLVVLLVSIRLLPREQRVDIATLFGYVPPAAVVYPPGEDLLHYCSQQLEPEPAGPEQPWNKMSYELLSFAQCFPVMHEVIDRYGHQLCIAPSPISKIAIRHVVTYLQQHPERWHEQAETLVLDALKEGYPCRTLPSSTARGN